MKIFFIVFIIFASCSKKQNDRALMRCIYDETAFAAVCKQAVADDSTFASFKRNGIYALLWQAHSREEGFAALNEMETHYPYLLQSLEQFRTSDSIGNPVTYNYGHYGFFSPTTLHHAQFAGTLLKQLGELSSRHIVQIGSGYGGACKAIRDLGGYKSYTLIDLPEHLALARKALEREGITDVRFLSCDEVPANHNWDIVISDFSFSEFSKPWQRLFLDRIVLRSHAGLCVCHTFPKHFGVEPFTPHELRKYLEKHLTNVEMSQPKGERSSYYFLWRN